MVATSPLLSGQVIRRMAEFFIVMSYRSARKTWQPASLQKVAVETLLRMSLQAALLL
jgi:hypothetical protein